MPKSENLKGRAFYDLTVEESTDRKENGYAVWLCRCKCGNTVYASSRQLKRGTIRGCSACWQYGKNKPKDLSGMRFGQLTVLSLAQERKHGRRSWLCKCSCGAEHIATAHDLLQGSVTSCGGGTHRKLHGYVDLTGRTVGFLEVLFPLEERDYKGSVIWRCLCTRCGKECDYSADILLHGNTVSCGCYREAESGKNLYAGLHHIDGTCVEFLQRKKRVDNTSGYTGVYLLKNGRYKACITFKKKRYYLGTFDTIDEAINARLKGEEMHEEFLEWYYSAYSDEGKSDQDRSVL